MPLGKVFDATQNQVLFSPVTNYYQGKAIRAGLKAQEQDSELKGLQIDLAKDELANAPSAREAAKERALLDAENIRSQIDERYAKGHREVLKYADEVMKPLFEAYGKEEDEDKALEIFNTGLPEAISRLPEEEQRSFIEAAGEDRVFDHDEIMRAGYARRYVEEKESLQKASFIGDDGRAIAGSYNSATGEHIDGEGRVHKKAQPIAPAASQEELGGLNRETPSNRDKRRAANESTSNLLGESAIALRRNREYPGAVGMLAAGQETLAGLPGVAGDAADEVGRQLTGHTAAEIATVRTQGRTLAAQYISTITGEESGRYTKEEQQIARDTEAQLSLWRSSDQVEAGLSELQAITIRGELRDRGAEFIYHETGQEIDILTEGGWNEWGNVLMNQFGLSKEKAFEELQHHEQIMIIKGRK